MVRSAGFEPTTSGCGRSGYTRGNVGGANGYAPLSSARKGIGRRGADSWADHGVGGEVEADPVLGVGAQERPGLSASPALQ